MAIILGRKPIIETPEYDDYAVGLALPIQIANVAFKQNYTEIEQLKSNIKNLLLTKRGERLMNPLFGTGIETVLFEPITDEFEDKVQTIITNSVERYVPNVSIDEINVDISNENKDKNSVNISLKFRSRNTGNTGNVSFSIQQTAP
jgi:phage baseplate assembly protein W